MIADDIYEDDTSPLAKYEAKELFQEGYEAQLAQNFETAIELYRRSIETYPTAEAHTFLGWVYSFQNRYDDASQNASKQFASTKPSAILTTTLAVTCGAGRFVQLRSWFKRALLEPRY